MRWLLYLTLCFNLSLFIIDVVDSKTQYVYLNSYTDCNSNEMFPVSLFKDYIVRPDVSSDTKSHSFRDCEVTFHSVREYGHICLVLVGNVGTITDPNAQLEGKDGLGDPDDKEIDNLKPFTHSWSHREYCSKGPYITLYLSKIRREDSANIRKVNIEFKVLDIESKDRALYLDGSYCSHTYYLENSMVTLWNRPQYSGEFVTMLTSECGIRFDKMDKTHNKSICFAYIPSDDMKCNSNWRFAISTADFDTDEKFFVYSLRCNHSEAKNIHVWCAEPNIDFVTVIFGRDENILSNSTIEPPKDFRYVVMDYEGSESSLLEKVSSLYGASSKSGLAGKWMIYTIAAVGLVIVIAIVICCCKRRMRYKPVNKGDTSTPV